MGDFVFWIAYRAIRLYLKLFRRWKVYGTENVPMDGPLIVAGNHISNLDPPVLGVAIPKRKTYFMAKKELFKPGFIDWFLRQLGAFPVNRGRADIEAMKKALGLLRDGKVLGVFPEGTRNKVGEMGKAQPGVISIALKAKAPILPCGLLNTDGGGPVIVQIGEPIYLDEYFGRKLTKEEAEEVGALVMSKIASLVELAKNS